MERPPRRSGVHPTDRGRCTPSPGKAHCGEWLPTHSPAVQCGTVGAMGRDTPHSREAGQQGSPTRLALGCDCPRPSDSIEEGSGS